MTLFLLFCFYTLIGEDMKVKLFDFESEKDLEEAINDFLDDDIEVIDINYQVSMGLFSEEQIYCFSALIVYTKN